MDKILLIGSGGHGHACVDVIEISGKYKIAGLVEKNEQGFKSILGYPILGANDDLENLRQQYSYALITVGQIKSPNIRIKLYNLLKELDFTLPVIISPKAYVSKHAQIGEGSIIMHGSIVNANAKIGKNCIINNQSLIEHDATIGDHCHISTNAIVNGGVDVGNNSFIGSGSVLIQSISIGAECVIGAGLVIKNDIEPSQLVRN